MKMKNIVTIVALMAASRVVTASEVNVTDLNECQKVLSAVQNALEQLPEAAQDQIQLSIREALGQGVQESQQIVHVQGATLSGKKSNAASGGGW